MQSVKSADDINSRHPHGFCMVLIIYVCHLAPLRTVNSFVTSLVALVAGHGFSSGGELAPAS